MINEQVSVFQLWKNLSRELSNLYDMHGVCAAIANEMALYLQTPVVMALGAPSGRYHDVWVVQPDGELLQARWDSSKTDLRPYWETDQVQVLTKHDRPASELVQSELWRLPQEKIVVTRLPHHRSEQVADLTGLIGLIDLPDERLSEEELFQTVSFLTPYLERASLRYQRDRQSVEFSVITEVSHSLASSLRLEDIFKQVSDDVRSLLAVESISLALIDQVTHKIVFVPEMMGALFTEIPPIELEPGEGIAGWVAANNEAVIVNDAYADKRFFSHSDTVSGFRTRSILAVPLRSENVAVGVLEAVNKHGGDFTEHDQLLLTALSGPLATAILNARLHQNVVSEKRRIETIFHSMSEGMLTVGVDGEITAVNDALLTLLRQERPSLLGQDAVSTIRLRNGTLEEFLEEVLATQSEEEFPQLACELKQNGSYVPVLLSGATITDEAGTPTEFVLAFSDLRQIREVERMRDDFFQGIIHELRTPLALILMYARLLLNGRADGDVEKTTRFLKTIEQESDRLQMMVRQMLQLAKLEASEIQRSSEPMDLNDLFSELLPPLADKATEKGLTFIQRIEPDLPELTADRTIMYMVFKNLTENAIKFTLDGTVRVEARNEVEGVRIEVSDEGIGIPEAALPNLFRRFYRAQTAVERGIAGTGIGLSLVKEGVEKHKGTITVESVEGQGTSFVIKLPVE